MMQYNMVQAAKIAENVDGNIADLVNKLCEDEPREVTCMVWSMVARRIAYRAGGECCFALPPLEEC